MDAELLTQSRLGLAMLADGRVVEAAALWREIATAAPDWPVGWNNLALAEIGAQRLADAIEPFRRSLALDPAQDEVRTNLAMTLLRLGQFEPAGAECQELVARQPKLDTAWKLLGIVHLRRNRFPEAVECFATAIQCGPAPADLHADHGLALLQAGRFAEARLAYAAAAALEPSYAAPGAMGGFAALLAESVDGDVPAAIGRYGATLADPQAALPQALKSAYLQLVRFDRREAAAAVADAWLARYPDDVEARHLSAASSGRPLASADPAYVAHYFDHYADRFEANIVDDLNYAVPDRLAEVLTPFPGGSAALDILDAGCGTGLCAAALRSRARRLVGVDLSAGMLAKAAERGLYDALTLGNLMTVLTEQRGAYDLIVAADVLIYFGALTPVFEAAFHALRPRGGFIFSLEATANDPAGFALQAAGRFAHGCDYVRQSVAPWFEIRQWIDMPIRREGLRDVDGQLVALMRREAE